MRGGIQQFIYRNARDDSIIWTLIVHTTILTSSYFLIDEVRCKSFTLNNPPRDFILPPSLFLA